MKDRPIAKIIALHEASHAVIAELRNVRVEFVTIRPSWGASAQVRFESDTSDPLITAAGDCGVYLYSPDGPELLKQRPHEPKAMSKAVEEILAKAEIKLTRPLDDEACLWVADPRMSREQIIGIVDQAMDLLEEHWGAVLRLVDELLQHGTVNGERVREIIAGKPPLPPGYQFWWTKPKLREKWVAGLQASIARPHSGHAAASLAMATAGVVEARTYQESAEVLPTV